MKATRRGFTIVELLIVIVVIAILAAISVVAYNGIQVRARNNAKISAATAIAKSFDAITIQSGEHFTHPRVCLPIGNQDVNGDGLGDCGNVTDAASIVRSESSTANSDLASRGLKNISFSTEPVTDSLGRKFAGIEHGNSASTYGLNGVLQPRYLVFYLEGNDVDCASPYSIRYVGGGSLGVLHSFSYARNALTSNGVTTCYFTLKDKASL